ncbi:MAG: glycosyltransferase [Candidatus Sumerlaeia bacterium]|nr:glycosyltransferase [Candidatus Sumerlaeia bacterium]
MPSILPMPSTPSTAPLPTHPSSLRVSVVIPAYQAESCIGNCLRSVLAQTLPRDVYEVIVVNNGSTDRTAEIAGGYDVRLIEEPRRGVAAARQTGVVASRGELVVFTDADCVADRAWLAALVARFDRQPALGGVGGYLATYQLQTPIQYYISERQLLAQEIALDDRPTSPPFLITANALIPKRLIEAVGGFDTRFAVSGEDADLCWRIADLGYCFAFAPDAVVYHHHRPTVKAFCRWMYRYGKGSVFLLKKHRHRLGIGPVYLDREHYRLWWKAMVRFLGPLPPGNDDWERKFYGYDVLRFACFTAGRIAGSLRHGAVVL